LIFLLGREQRRTRLCVSTSKTAEHAIASWVTNNEVSENEQKVLRKQNLRPGDPEWEKLGICDYITKPRVQAAITGKTPEGKLIKGDYKFTDEFPMADGFEENAEFLP